MIRVDQRTKVKFSVKDFFSKFFRKLRIWSHLLKKSLIENFIFCAEDSGVCKRKKLVILSSFRFIFYFLNPLSANPTKWSNTLK